MNTEKKKFLNYDRGLDGYIVNWYKNQNIIDALKISIKLTAVGCGMTLTCCWLSASIFGNKFRQ